MLSYRTRNPHAPINLTSSGRTVAQHLYEQQLSLECVRTGRHGKDVGGPSGE